MLSDKPEVDCLFAGDDFFAALLMNELSRPGYLVPEELAICGFDNIAWTQLLKPTLTTVHQPKLELGQIASNMLLNRGGSTPEFRSEVLPTSLVVRDSTAGFRRNRTREPLDRRRGA